MDERGITNKAFLPILKLVAPGTPLREGLENILRAKTGALIALGDSEELLGIVDGGFNINCELTPARIYELAKMDGAILLSKDGTRILVANAHLVPDPSLPTDQTGTRHRTAERVSKQTRDLVISISQRRDIISLFYGEEHYILEDIRVILTKANQALQTLEKYRNVLDQTITNLSALEFEDMVTVSDVVLVVQRAEMVLDIQREIERYVNELGDEGRLIRMQLDELVANVWEETLMIIRDYGMDEEGNEPVDAESILNELLEWTSEDLVNMPNISKILGHGGNISSLENPVSPRGYRLLRKIPRLPLPVIENLIQEFGRFQTVLGASIEKLDEVDGIGEVRAKAIKDGLHRLKEQVFLDRQI